MKLFSLTYLALSTLLCAFHTFSGFSILTPSYKSFKLGWIYFAKWYNGNNFEEAYFCTWDQFHQHAYVQFYLWRCPGAQHLNFMLNFYAVHFTLFTSKISINLLAAHKMLMKVTLRLYNFFFSIFLPREKESSTRSLFQLKKVESFSFFFRCQQMKLFW